MVDDDGQMDYAKSDKMLLKEKGEDFSISDHLLPSRTSNVIRE